MRLVIDESNTLGKAAMARESGAPSLICSQRPTQRARWRGSLMRTESRRTASPAERPLLSRSKRDSRNGRHSARRGAWAAGRAGLKAAADFPLGAGGVADRALAAPSAVFPLGMGRAVSWTEETWRPRAERRRRASLRLGASRSAARVFPARSRAV